jgi:hypothetical protein
MQCLFSCAELLENERKYMYLRMTTPQGWEAGHEISDCDMHELIHSFSISRLDH